MLSRTLAVVALVACFHAVTAAPREAPSGIFEGIDLFGLQWASDPQVRPDGRTVAYVRGSYDVMTDKERQSIWLIDVQSKTQTPLPSTAISDFSPTWSPQAAHSYLFYGLRPGLRRASLIWSEHRARCLGPETANPSPL
jgi:hypothetical protein